MTRLEFEVTDGKQARTLIQRLIGAGWNVDSQIVAHDICVEVVATKEGGSVTDVEQEGWLDDLPAAKLR